MEHLSEGDALLLINGVWRPAIIESPFKAQPGLSTEEEHRIYLNRLIRHAILNGYTPYASHKMLTDAFDDANKFERRVGMSAGLSLSKILVEVGATPIFGVDYGETEGMLEAKELYKSLSITCCVYRIGKNDSGRRSK